MRDFLAENIEHLASINHGNIQVEQNQAKVGKLGLKLISKELNLDENGIDSNRLCSMISDEKFPLKVGDDIDYKNVVIGIHDGNELQEGIDAMVSRGEKLSKNDSRATLKVMATEFKDIFL